MSSALRAWRRFGFSALFSGIAAAGLAQNPYSPQGGEYPIAGALPGEQVFPQISIDSTGGYLVWQDNVTDGDGLGISARRINSNLSGSFGVFRVNERGAGDQQLPRVSLLNKGGAVFVWQSGSSGTEDIYARFLGPDGTLLTGDVQVNTYTKAQQITPVVAALADGSAVIAWSSYGQDGSMLGVFAQRFSSAGEKLGGEFRVNQFASYNQRSPAVSALDNDNFVVVWVSEQQRFENSVDLYARLYRSSGEPVGNEFLVNSQTNVCANPAVARAADGGFVVTWAQMDIADPTNAWDVFVRSFNAQGAPMSDTLRVNAYTRRNQYAPQISSIGSDHLIVWTSNGQDRSREGIFGRFLSAGEVAGPEFPVNTTWISQQIHPAVASNGRNGFVAVWASYVGGANSFDLLAQRYSAGPSLGPPPPPFVSALDQFRLSVTWPVLAGYTNLARYALYLDANDSPVLVTNNFHVADGLMPGSTHSFRLAYQLTDGRSSPISDAASGQTWGRDANFDGLP